MRKFGFLLLSLAVTALTTAPNAFANTCQDICQAQFSRAAHQCVSMYAGDSDLMYWCGQDAQAQYNTCMSYCL